MNILIVTEKNHIPDQYPIWGTGGWLSPDEREALDWYTLIHCMGWTAVAVSIEEMVQYIYEHSLINWIIIACPPESIDSENLNKLIKIIKVKGINVIFRQGNVDYKVYKNAGFLLSSKPQVCKTVTWEGRGERRTWNWEIEHSFQSLHQSKHSQSLATCGNHMLISKLSIAEHCGIILLGFHPSEVRDKVSCFSSILIHLLVYGTNKPAAWIDWSGVMLLRMDDPGSSETVHNNIYMNLNKLNAFQLRRIANILKDHYACINIGYVSGWVDDANEERGVLIHEDSVVSRVPGQVYPSPGIKYISNSGKTVNYQEEYHGILELLKAGLADLAAHGYTHIFPDYNEWLSASDRYINEKWFREHCSEAINFIKASNNDSLSLELAVDTIFKYFGKKPTVLINPGEVFTDKIQLIAIDLGFKIISSYYTAIRINNVFCWMQHLCAPYLDKPDHDWFKAELPVIGYFHDFDIVRCGLDWFNENLHKWETAGASSFYDFSTLSAVMDLTLKLLKENDDFVLELEHVDVNKINKPIRIKINLPFMEHKKRMMVRYMGQIIEVGINQLDEHTALMILDFK